MTDRLNLPLPYRRILVGLLREHVPEAEVWAYGSRITGESHEGSDLDLVVRGPELKPLGDGFFQLVEAIEKSNIPILVQGHDWARLPESFIERSSGTTWFCGRGTRILTKVCGGKSELARSLKS